MFRVIVTVIVRVIGPKKELFADKSALVCSTAVDISDIDMFFFSALS